MFKYQILFQPLLLIGCIMTPATQQLSAADPLVFISAFTSGEAGAIHAYRLKSDTGQLQLLHKTTEVENPFFLALAPNQKFLYSIHAEAFGGKDDEMVVAYAIEDRSGKLKMLNKQSAEGTASCYLDVDSSNRAVVVANYSSGDVAALPIQKDGSLGKATSYIKHTGTSVNQQRQQEPHAHCFVISPDGRFAFAADLGIDKIMCYQLDAKSAKLTANKQPYVRTPPGAGPRHLTFHPNGKHLYVINELLNSVTHYNYEPSSGYLLEQQTISTLPTGFDGTSYCADLKITPNGKYLYGTNRGHDSIACYKIGDNGELTLLSIEPSLGKGPQNLLITPDGKHLLCANMPGDNVAVFRIDQAAGTIKSIGQPIAMPKPSCIMLLP